MEQMTTPTTFAASRPVKGGSLKIMAPGPAAGGWDETAQAIRRGLLGTGFASDIVIECRPGGGGTKGLADFLDSHRADPNALLVGGYVMVGAIIGNRSAHSLTDVTPIARLTGEVEAVAVSRTSTFGAMSDLVDAWRSDPGSVTWATGAVGGVGQVAVSMVAQAVGVKPEKQHFTHYSSGGEAAAAASRGETTAVMTGFREISHLGDALRPLGVAADRRIPGLDAPTLKEQGIDVQIMNWRMVAAAPGIGEEREVELSQAVDAMVASEGWQRELAAHGWEGRYLAGNAFKAFLAEQVEQTSRTLRELGVG
jgi:putative tricarboxylic transport membrane protein